MTNMFLERSFDAPLTRDDVIAQARDCGWCFEAHRGNWHGSFLARGGRKLVCRFEAADAEAVRLAQQKAGMPFTRVWSFETIGKGDLAD